jgi:hypothetical protein
MAATNARARAPLLTDLQKQYDSGAKFRIETLWDAGFDVATSADLKAPTEQYRTLRQAVATLVPSPTAPLKPSDPLSILQQLYDSEFNFMLIAGPTASRCAWEMPGMASRGGAHSERSPRALKNWHAKPKSSTR